MDTLQRPRNRYGCRSEVVAKSSDATLNYDEAARLSLGVVQWRCSSMGPKAHCRTSHTVFASVNGKPRLTRHGCMAGQRTATPWTEAAKFARRRRGFGNRLSKISLVGNTK